MATKTLRILLFIILMFGAYESAAHAQEKIPPEKRELIKELLELTGGAKNINAMLDAMSQQQERDLPRLLAQAASSNERLTLTQRAELERSIKESTVRVNERMRELYLRVNVPQMIVDMAASSFDKHFTEGELKEWIAFYKSPVGKKSVELLPVMMTEMMVKMSESLLPKIQVELEKIIADEARHLDEGISAASTPKRVSKPRKRARH